MKKFLVVALAAVSVSSFAREGVQVAMESVETPLFMHHGSEAKPEAYVIRVLENGKVQAATCGVRAISDRFIPSQATVVVNHSSCEWTTLKYLTRKQIRNMQSDIEDARDGELKQPEFTCLAMPHRYLDQTADSGQIILNKGAIPCGVNTYNDSVGGQRLREQLDELRSEYDQVRTVR